MAAAPQIQTKNEDTLTKRAAHLLYKQRLTTMKPAIKTSLLLSFLAALSMTSCDAYLDSSWDTYPDYYGAGVGSDWYPSLPGSPYISPVYWGGQLYPGSVLPPLPPTRPGWTSPIINRPIGNVRTTRPGGSLSPAPLPSVPSTPLQPSTPTRPSTSVVPPAGYIPPSQVTGGQPGIQLPPPSNNQGRH